MLKPGGILVIDHRNYDEILKSGNVPAKNVYYNVSVCSVKNEIEVLWMTFLFNQYCATNTQDLKIKGVFSNLQSDEGAGP